MSPPEVLSVEITTSSFLHILFLTMFETKGGHILTLGLGTGRRHKTPIHNYILGSKSKYFSNIVYEENDRLIAKKSVLENIRPGLMERSE